MMSDMEADVKEREDYHILLLTTVLVNICHPLILLLYITVNIMSTTLLVATSFTLVTITCTIVTPTSFCSTVSVEEKGIRLRRAEKKDGENGRMNFKLEGTARRR